MASEAASDSNKAGSVAPVDESRGVKPLRVKVNGVEIEVTEELVVARELVVKAKEKGGIAGYVDEYVVERLNQEGEIRIDETIRITEHEEFLAVPVEATPTARSACVASQMNAIDEQVKSELEDLGYETDIEEGNTAAGRQRVVTFAYQVPTGRFKGQTYAVGISTQCEAVGYPEVPPHWIFVSPPLEDTRDGSNHGINTFGGKEWTALSRPPRSFWDRVQNKGMRAYMDHLARVWRHI